MLDSNYGFLWFLMLAIGISVNFFCIVRFKRFDLLSLSVAFILVQIFIFLGGFIVYALLSDDFFNSLSFPLYVLNRLLFGLFIFTFGVLWAGRKGGLPSFSLGVGLVSLNPGFVFLLAMVFLVASVSLIGVSDIMQRDVYETGQSVSNKSLRALAEMLTPIAPFMLGFVYAKGPQSLKVGAVIIFSLYLLYYIGMTTRFLAITPLLFVVGAWFANPEWKNKGRWLLFAVVLFPLLLYIPLNSRAMDEQGIIPVTNWLFNGAGSQFGIGYDSVWFRMLRNFFHGFYATTETFSSWPSIPIKYFWVSVNPLPGSVVGWYDLALDLRVNKFVPFNVYGELMGRGYFLSCLFWLVLGFVFASIDIKTRDVDINAIIRILAYMSVMMFVMLSFQYNLRSAVRFIYISIFFITMGHLWGRWRHV
ncbi:hypothetical protein G8764_19945 [Pseudomaricurvus alcaniphilus]|uniref:hypothetical protein n=1 Tax=Pseudomaricurvus alcaniphilus TaxID=1166482 RepID=UPI0014099F7B|nr:hypothetical protein [Pseudomaricurvus alcaniphilus]NHN39579.1 hypothetical protein [Pseudomaricurvus alcaniphilus]